MARVKIGLVQMTCTADKEANLQKAVLKIKEAAAKGAQIVACRNSLPHCISAMWKTMIILNWQNPFRSFNRNLK